MKFRYIYQQLLLNCQLDLGNSVNVLGNLTANTPHFISLFFTDEVSVMGVIVSKKV